MTYAVWRHRATEALHEVEMSQAINYESLLRDASLDVVRIILNLIARNGLYKKQHLYITFASKYPGIKMIDEFKDEDEMTIVLQHEFWDLKIDDYGFSVSLAFDNSDETIYIPFSSLICVNVPSEDFSLNFVPIVSDIKNDIIENNKQYTNKIISLADFRKR